MRYNFLKNAKFIENRWPSTYAAKGHSVVPVTVTAWEQKAGGEGRGNEDFLCSAVGWP